MLTAWMLPDFLWYNTLLVGGLLPPSGVLAHWKGAFTAIIRLDTATLAGGGHAGERAVGNRDAKRGALLPRLARGAMVALGSWGDGDLRRSQVLECVSRGALVDGWRLVEAQAGIKGAV